METMQITTITEQIAFTYGDCWVLALEIHKQYGLPVAFFIGSETANDDANPNIYWVHAFNALPNGTYLDVKGVHTREDLHGRWAEELESGVPDIVQPAHVITMAILDGEPRHYSNDATVTAQKLHNRYRFGN